MIALWAITRAAIVANTASSVYASEKAKREQAAARHAYESGGTGGTPPVPPMRQATGRVISPPALPPPTGGDPAQGPR